VRQSLNRRNARTLELLDDAFAESLNALKRRRCRARELCHLLLDFLALFFFALDIDLPAEQLGRKTNVLTLLSDRERQLTVIDHDFQVLFDRIQYGDATHL